MSKGPAAGSSDGAPNLSEREVIAYLFENSDFFDRHPEVLEHLNLRHSAGSAVSLIERQIEILRVRNHQLQSRLAELLETARENEARVWHLNNLARMLIGAESAGDLVTGLASCLKRDFEVDAVFIGIKGVPPKRTPMGLRYLDSGDSVLKSYDNFFRMGQVVCGPLKSEQSRLLFPQQPSDVPLLSSAAVPLGKPSTRGLMVLASRDARRFQPDMGTMFLELLADLVATALRHELSGEAKHG